MAPGQSEVFDAMVACGFVADAAFEIGDIEAGVKPEQETRLFQHLGGAARGILAHAIGDQILDRDGDESGVIGEATDEQEAAMVDRAIHRCGGDHFEAETEIGMDPAERGVADPLRLGEAEAAQFFFQLRLDGGREVDVAGHQRAASKIFHRRAGGEGQGETWWQWPESGRSRKTVTRELGEGPLPEGARDHWRLVRCGSCSGRSGPEDDERGGAARSGGILGKASDPYGRGLGRLFYLRYNLTTSAICRITASRTRLCLIEPL